MARPTKFNEIRAARFVARVRCGQRRHDAARAEGFGMRTIYDWLRRGRAGEAPYVEFADTFREAAEISRRRRIDRWWRQYDEQSRERWQRFKASRQAWWLNRLGPSEFWTRRLRWLINHDRMEAYHRTVAQLRAAGFRIEKSS